MKFKFSKNFEQFMISHKISRFFDLDCYAFPVKLRLLDQFCGRESLVTLQ